jgi:hypothetical protein
MTEILIITGVALFVVLIMASAYYSFRLRRQKHQFQLLAKELDLVESGISNNPDYQYFYDSYSNILQKSVIWQTKTIPRVYLSPRWLNAIEISIFGKYNLPKIQLDSKHNKTHVYGTKDKLTKLNLEGNFNEYFSISCEKGYELIALQIFSPDIMQEMIDNHIYIDLIINGSSILYVSAIDNWDSQSVKVLLDYALKLEKIIRAVNKVSSGLKT